MFLHGRVRINCHWIYHFHLNRSIKIKRFRLHLRLHNYNSVQSVKIHSLCQEFRFSAIPDCVNEILIVCFNIAQILKQPAYNPNRFWNDFSSSGNSTTGICNYVRVWLCILQGNDFKVQTLLRNSST